MTDDYTPPNAEEIRRVAQHWERVKALGCSHPTMTFCASDPLMCAECRHPLTILSDVQMADRKIGRPGGTKVDMAEVLKRFERGGITVIRADGEYEDIRLTAFRSYGNGDEIAPEVIGLTLDELTTIVNAQSLA